MAAVMVSLPVAPLTELVDKHVLDHDSLAPSELFLGTVLDTIPSSSSSGTRTSGSSEPPTTTISPVDDTPIAGPSRQRHLFIAVRRGHSTGVFTSWAEAEKHVADHPCPLFKTFSTRLAAEAYVVGWDGHGKHALPASTPRPLREHLAMTFPSSVPLPPPSMRRPSYHSRMLDTYPPPPAGSEWPYAVELSDFAPAPTIRQPRSTGSLRTFRTSTVYSSSPLRMQIEGDEDVGRKVKKASSMIGLGGLLSPPASPKLETRDKRPGPSRARSGLWADPPTPPASPKVGPSVPQRRSTLWDSTPAARPASQPALAAAPTFSRSAMKKSRVIMPVAAPKLKSSTSLTNLTFRKSTTSTSLTSHNLNKRSSTLATIPHGQDRLATLVEMSKRELERDSDHLGPPRPSFMRRSSTSSVSSLSSLGSLSPPSSITEEDEEEPREILSPLEMDHGPVIIQPVAYVDATIMSCTKSDGDVDGSVDSRSTKSGTSGGKPPKRGGGLFKRFSRVLKIDKGRTV